MSGLTCQQCKQPVQIDESLIDLTPSAFELVTGSIPKPGASSKHTTAQDLLAKTPGHPAVKSAWERAQGGGDTARRKAPFSTNRQHRASVAGGESFVLLQDSIIRNIPPGTGYLGSPKGKGKALPKEVNSSAAIPPANVNPTPLSHHLRSVSRLYSTLSARTELDHPLCDECTHSLLGILNRQLQEIQREREGYIAFEKEVKKERERDTDPKATKVEAERKIKQLKDEEALAVQELRNAERERQALEAELKQLELEDKRLEEEEADFWRSHNATMLSNEEQAARLLSLQAAYAADAVTLDRLEHTNVYNDAFCIGQEGNIFGTINGLRFGRTGIVDGQSITVEWTEVNAAWGQAALLLQTIARKLDFTFENYRLIPLGSFSKVERTSDKNLFELYGTGDIHLGRLLHNRRFDSGMIAFLDCVRQLMEHVKREDPSIQFPNYCTISKEKIGEYSVKLPFSGTDEAWSRALKNVLFALKALLRYATKLTA